MQIIWNLAQIGVDYDQQHQRIMVIKKIYHQNSNIYNTLTRIRMVFIYSHKTNGSGLEYWRKQEKSTTNNDKMK